VKTVFDATDLRGLKLKNRMFRSATWEQLADMDGRPTEEHLQIYRELAEGGIGAVITGFTSVDDNDHGLPGMMRLGNDTQISAYRRLTETVKRHNTAIIAQLALGEYRERSGGSPLE
jgi:2,4-dienoyl-CoA reductase-like NADH-dependent reductase (Old Yellow Enzyme family)